MTVGMLHGEPKTTTIPARGRLVPSTLSPLLILIVVAASAWIIPLGSAQSSVVDHPDVLYVVDVEGGRNPGGLSWADSYSVGGECYCDISSFDHGAGVINVQTPFGWKTVREVCEDIIGPGPGPSGRPVYNDVQCGNGPPNDAGDEHTCPGRTDIGEEGCGYIGPKWKFPSAEEAAEKGIVTTPRLPPESASPDVVADLAVPGTINPGGVGWGDSYSVGKSCYCDSSFDHGIGTFMVQTDLGWKSVRTVCGLLGPGPGKNGRPVYNDVQCGNGPPNDASDEQPCPGRTDIGPEGCGQVGPTWYFGIRWKVGGKKGGVGLTAPFLDRIPDDSQWYVMYSKDKVRQRFNVGGQRPSKGMAKHFLFVFYDPQDQRWKYDRAIVRKFDDGARLAVPRKRRTHIPFWPKPGDRLLARLDVAAEDQVSLSILDGINHEQKLGGFLSQNKINGVSAGYLGGVLELEIRPEQSPGLIMVNLRGNSFYVLEQKPE